MVNAVTGVLIECDTTVKAIIKNLDSKHHFIVDDLDDTHVFIVSTWVDRLKSELERLLDENAYTISDPKDPKNWDPSQTSPTSVLLTLHFANLELQLWASTIPYHIFVHISNFNNRSNTLWKNH